MHVILYSTNKIVALNGVPARIWEGHTNTGIKVHCFITRIVISKDEPPEAQKQFEAELIECSEPSPDVVLYPGRLIV